LRVLASGEPGVLGAAMMAGVGAGHFAHITDALGALAIYDRTYTPDPTQRARSDDLYALYAEAIMQTGDLGKRLTQLNAQ
jgi:xylulokinase